MNYYYQGKVDNCVMGGLANAVFLLMGPDELDQLLKDHSLTISDFWMKFVKKVNGVLPGYELRKYSCFDILQMDDAYPVVVQLRAADQSERHAVCIFKGAIYDSASRYVLFKKARCFELVLWFLWF
jgi:hypothetical protein